MNPSPLLLPAATVAALFLGATPPARAGTPTFNHDIAPIVYQNCTGCHREGEAAPFTLGSYHDVQRKGKTIARAVHSRVMPPWKAEPASYPYRDERRLTADQIQRIEDWVAGGMPEGDPAEKVQPPSFPSGWRLGEPDLVVEMPLPYHVPADGPDIYRNIAAPLGLTGDKWVTAIDMHPSARAAVHHVLYFADTKGKAHERKGDGPEPGFGGMRPGGAVAPLGGWAVGAQPAFFPGGYALTLPQGSDLVIQYHFHPTGKPEVEKARVGFYFAKQKPDRSLVRIQMPPHYSLFSGLDIPAGEKDFVLRDSYTLPAAVDGLGVAAHAHYLATRMSMTATLPDGAVKTLLTIKDWDFNWQDRYFFQDLVPLPAGTKLDVEIHWDNSAGNPHNPTSPPVRVAWGEESKDEMGSISLIAVAHDQPDHGRLQANIREHVNGIVVDRLAREPEMRLKLARLLAE